MYDQKCRKSYRNLCSRTREWNKKKSENKFKFYGSNLNERIIRSYFFFIDFQKEKSLSYETSTKWANFSALFMFIAL